MLDAIVEVCQDRCRYLWNLHLLLSCAAQLWNALDQDVVITVV